MPDAPDAPDARPPTACPPSAAAVLTAAAAWLLGPPPVAPRAGERPRLVISIERDGSVLLECSGSGAEPAAEDAAEPAGEPAAEPAAEPALREACSAWTVERTGAVTRLRLVLDPCKLDGRLDDPRTLFALHALARERDDARIILKLPPEHVGRHR